jgi:hypothetical protein
MEYFCCFSLAAQRATTISLSPDRDDFLVATKAEAVGIDAIFLQSKK